MKGFAGPCSSAVAPGAIAAPYLPMAQAERRRVGYSRAAFRNALALGARDDFLIAAYADFLL
jgi:hypothetical protein